MMNSKRKCHRDCDHLMMKSHFMAVFVPEMLERRIARTNEMIKELYRKDENDKYVHSFLERNAIYGITGESYALKDENGKE